MEDKRVFTPSLPEQTSSHNRGRFIAVCGLVVCILLLFWGVSGLEQQQSERESLLLGSGESNLLLFWNDSELRESETQRAGICLGSLQLGLQPESWTLTESRSMTAHLRLQSAPEEDKDSIIALGIEFDGLGRMTDLTQLPESEPVLDKQELQDILSSVELHLFRLSDKAYSLVLAPRPDLSSTGKSTIAGFRLTTADTAEENSCPEQLGEEDQQLGEEEERPTASELLLRALSSLSTDTSAIRND